MKRVLVHIILWVLVIIYVVDSNIDYYEYSKDVIGLSIFELGIYVILFYLNLLVLLPRVLQKEGVLAYLLSCTGVIVVIIGIYYAVGYDEYVFYESVWRSFLILFIAHAAYFLLSFLFWYFEKYQEERSKRLQLENDKLQSEMELLKNQISPHFLFNSLNNIYSLVISKSDDAPKMITTLSDILRYVLYEGNKPKVFLESEIEMIEKYIQIQEFRQIPGKDNIRFNIKGHTAGIKVPPMILITLIENAFKHGDIVEKNEGFVHIDLHVQESDISFSITNSFEQKDTQDGIGLKNVRSQLDILYGTSYDMKTETINNQYQVSIRFNAG